MRVRFVSRWKFNPYETLLAGALRRAGIELVDSRPDVLHLHNVHTAASSVLRYLGMLVRARLTRVRIVWTVHDLRRHDNPRPLRDALITAVTLRLAHALILHCDEGRRELGRFAKKAITIPHGRYTDHYENRVTRDDARRTLGVPDGAFVFLLFGWIRRYKGVEQLLDAFERLGGNAHLVLAGSVPDFSLLHELQRRTSGNTRITFAPGAVPDERVQLYMNACDAVVLPYRHGFTSGAAILAMSFAKPCIAVRRGCIGGMLDEGGAFLYEGDALLDAMQRATSAQDVAAMGAHNYARVMQWDWDRVARETVDLYEQRALLYRTNRGSQSGN
ncbi:MAG TPA: glycosyltransferase family 4 protein [Thermoanaerobaculia bacterium]|nr:glycosyltransferase family 4 protein [Thermoanaerobaculia bacterium]